MPSEGGPRSLASQAGHPNTYFFHSDPTGDSREWGQTKRHSKAPWSRVNPRSPQAPALGERPAPPEPTFARCILDNRENCCRLPLRAAGRAGSCLMLAGAQTQLLLAAPARPLPTLPASAATLGSAPSAVSIRAQPPSSCTSLLRALSHLSRPSHGLPAPLSLCNLLSLWVAPVTRGLCLCPLPSHLSLSLTHSLLPNLGRGKLGGCGESPAFLPEREGQQGSTESLPEHFPEQASSFPPGCALPHATSPYGQRVE